MGKVLITGGAGFIGSNLAKRLLIEGHDVTVFDNLSRPGADSNLKWLVGGSVSGRFLLVEADVRDFPALLKASDGMDYIYHLAGQVAVTTSVINPRVDFEANALGTFNALEAARLAGNDPVFLYASTNKVYGALEDVTILEEKTRYSFEGFPIGIPESQPLDFHSPYGCSKGAGDQYARDYFRIYGLRTVVLRQSCIYGYRQFGVEDQGWVAWFIIAALKGREITIYGDGKQVRDILFIDDLLDAYEAVVKGIDRSAGHVYNLGGGPGNTISIWLEFGPLLEEILGRTIPVKWAGCRPGDQAAYISDISKIQAELGWSPKIAVEGGVRRLFKWIQANKTLFSHL